MICAALFSFSAKAVAQTETFTLTYALGYCLTNPNGPNPVALPSFNTKLGTLDEVKVSFDYFINPILRIDNSTGATLAFTNASVTEPVTGTGPGNLDLSTLLTANLKSGQANPGVTTDVLKPTQGFASEEIASDAFGVWENQPGQRVHFEMTPGLPTFAGTPQGAGLSFGGSGDDWGAVILQYTYTKTLAAPEPPGKFLTALVGLALIAVVFARRRTRAI